MSKVILRVLLISTIILCFCTEAFAQRYRGINVTKDITAAEVAVLGSWKVNVVRYQLAFHGVADNATKAQYLVLLEAALRHLDSLLPVFNQYGIKVFLDLHTPPGGFYSEAHPSQFRVFAEQWAADALVDVWQLIAARYKGNSTIVAYEVLSEPAVGSNKLSQSWQALAARLINTVLAIDPSRKFIVAPDYAQQAKLLPFGKALRNLLGTDVYQEHVMHSVHLFTPYNYVKQGIEGKKKTIKYPSKKANKKLLVKSVKKVVLAKRKLKTELWIGEFSVVRWAPGAHKYLRDLIKVFEKQRWNWTYHIFRESDVWSVEHSSNRKDTDWSATETSRAKVLKKFFAKN